MMLHRSPELHVLLQAVAEGHIVHHSGTCGAWPIGWSWETGAHMTEQTQSDVDDLWHARLVTFNSPANPCGNRCLLTFAGSERLAAWNVRWPATPLQHGRQSVIENTADRDPLFHLLGSMGGSDRYITEMESAGQRQLVHSDRLPTKILGSTAEDFDQSALARKQAAGLRALADMIEANPDVARFADLGNLYAFHVNTAADQASLARAALRHGAKVDKDVWEKQHNLILRWGVVGAYVLASRGDVCERVVTGVETVTEVVPDPELLATVPTVEVTREVETYEWVCKPLLAASSDTEGCGTDD